MNRHIEVGHGLCPTCVAYPTERPCSHYPRRLASDSRYLRVVYRQWNQRRSQSVILEDPVEPPPELGGQFICGEAVGLDSGSKLTYHFIAWDLVVRTEELVYNPEYGELEKPRKRPVNVPEFEDWGVGEYE